MARLLPLAFLLSCGSQVGGSFEEAVSTASREFEQCRTGQYLPPEDFPYSESAALSVCSACWLGERPPIVYCSAELDSACDDLLSHDGCDCVWGTRGDEDVCRQCLLDHCGVQAITDETAACARASCDDARDACAFSADCTVP